MKRFICASVFCLILVSQNTLAQFICMDGGSPTTYTPDTECPLSSTGSSNMQVSAYLVALQFAQSYPIVASFSGDLGGVINDGTAVTSIGTCTTVSDAVGQPPPLHFSTNYSPGVHIVTASISRCYQGQYIPFKVATLEVKVDPPPPPPGVPVLIDPIAANLVHGGQITPNQEQTMAQATNVVGGVAADGAARVVVRVPAGQAGRALTIAVMNDSIPSTVTNSTDDDGGLTT
jgi:hypothetical protein